MSDLSDSEEEEQPSDDTNELTEDDLVEEFLEMMEFNKNFISDE